MKGHNITVIRAARARNRNEIEDEEQIQAEPNYGQRGEET